MINVNEFDYEIVKRAFNHAKTIRTNKKVTYYEIVTSFDPKGAKVCIYVYMAICV